MSLRILTVSDYISLLNETLSMIPGESFVIEGEVAEFNVSHGKWVNFCLKDEKAEAKVSCFMTTFQLKMPVENGMRVQIQGSAKIYEKFGKFSLNVHKLELVGEGALAKAYELLKKKLAEEGLFDISRKRSIPRFPSRIGLITSTEAAAYGDFIRILNNRCGGVEVMVSSVHVQGQYAVPEILGAFAYFQSLPFEERPDVLVLTRGGGSLEDLHAFNDEQVARAVFQSNIPVVVGVGHERDESLCDFVADVRASTPSNAAERVVPDRRDILREVERHIGRVEDVLQMQIDRRRHGTDRSLGILERFLLGKTHQVRMTMERFGHAFDRFRLSLVATRQYLERAQAIVTQSFTVRLDGATNAVQSLTRLFESFDVQRVLDRGYAIVRSGGRAVRDGALLAPGSRLQIQLARGSVEVDVAEKKKQAKLI